MTNDRRTVNAYHLQGQMTSPPSQAGSAALTYPSGSSPDSRPPGELSLRTSSQPQSPRAALTGPSVEPTSPFSIGTWSTVPMEAPQRVAPTIDLRSDAPRASGGSPAGIPTSGDVQVHWLHAGDRETSDATAILVPTWVPGMNEPTRNTLLAITSAIDRGDAKLRNAVQFPDVREHFWPRLLQLELEWPGTPLSACGLYHRGSHVATVDVHIHERRVQRLDIGLLPAHAVRFEPLHQHDVHLPRFEVWTPGEFFSIECSPVVDEQADIEAMNRLGPYIRGGGLASYTRLFLYDQATGCNWPPATMARHAGLGAMEAAVLRHQLNVMSQAITRMPASTPSDRFRRLGALRNPDNSLWSSNYELMWLLTPGLDVTEYATLLGELRACVARLAGAHEPWQTTW